MYLESSSFGRAFTPVQTQIGQDGSQGFKILQPQAAAPSESDAECNGVKPISGFVNQNRQI